MAHTFNSRSVKSIHRSSGRLSYKNRGSEKKPVCSKESAPGWAGAPDLSRARATQGHWDHTTAGIEIGTKGSGKVILREGVDGQAMVCDIIEGDSASLIV